MVDGMIGVIGAGVVGQATARAWIEHCREVRVYDTDRTKSVHSFNSLAECRAVFVCVPERSVETVVERADAMWPKAGRPVIVIRSTVTVGTTRTMAEVLEMDNLVHSPEFLTARCSTLDAQLPARNVIGYPPAYGSVAARNLATGTLHDVYAERWPHVPILSMTSDESEALKLAVNGFFAVKVAYFNEVYQFCRKAGLSWAVMWDGMMGDGRIHPSHTLVPGPDGRTGFGGACLPKDLVTLIDAMEGVGCEPMVSEAARLRNLNIDRPGGQP